MLSAVHLLECTAWSSVYPYLQSVTQQTHIARPCACVDRKTKITNPSAVLRNSNIAGTFLKINDLFLIISIFLSALRNEPILHNNSDVFHYNFDFNNFLMSPRTRKNYFEKQNILGFSSIHFPFFEIIIRWHSSAKGHSKNSHNYSRGSLFDPLLCIDI